jgi:hypothetical protein
MPFFSNGGAPTGNKVIVDTGRNNVSELHEDPNPSIEMRYQEYQERINRVQIIINACIVHECTQKRIRIHKQNRARKVRASKVSISHSAVRAMVTLFRDTYQIPMVHEGKTFGYLDRGEAHSFVLAVSGWSGGQFAGIDGCVDRELWTKRVFDFSRIVGHSLARHKYDDHGREGSFHACHAEKQLIAFILWHYTSLQEEPAQPAPEAEWARHEKMSELHQCVFDSTPPMTPCTKHCQNYCGTPVEAIRPVIRFTNIACCDCMQFRARVFGYTGIDNALKEIA